MTGLTEPSAPLSYTRQQIVPIPALRRRSYDRITSNTPGRLKMEHNNGFTGLSVRTVAQDFTVLVVGALATATAVACVAMGLVLLLAQ